MKYRVQIDKGSEGERTRAEVLKEYDSAELAGAYCEGYNAARRNVAGRTSAYVVEVRS